MEALFQRMGYAEVKASSKHPTPSASTPLTFEYPLEINNPALVSGNSISHGASPTLATGTSEDGQVGNTAQRAKKSTKAKAARRVEGNYALTSRRAGPKRGAVQP
jgi:hypothetical protein